MPKTHSCSKHCQQVKRSSFYHIEEYLYLTSGVTSPCLTRNAHGNPWTIWLATRDMEHWIWSLPTGVIELKSEDIDFFEELHPHNLRCLQAIGKTWKVLGCGRTHPWTSNAAIFMGHHKPHLHAQLHAYRGLPVIIIWSVYNFPSVPRSLTLSLLWPTGKWSRFLTLSKEFHLSVSGLLNKYVVVSLFQYQDQFLAALTTQPTQVDA